MSTLLDQLIGAMDAAEAAPSGVDVSIRLQRGCLIVCATRPDSLTAEFRMSLDLLDANKWERAGSEFVEQALHALAVEAGARI